MGRIKLPSGRIFRERQRMPKPFIGELNTVGGEEIAMALQIGEMIYKSPLLRDAVGGLEQLFKSEGPTEEVLAEAAKVRQAVADKGRAEDKMALLAEQKVAAVPDPQLQMPGQEPPDPGYLAKAAMAPEISIPLDIEAGPGLTPTRTITTFDISKKLHDAGYEPEDINKIIEAESKYYEDLYKDKKFQTYLRAAQDTRDIHEIGIEGDPKKVKLKLTAPAYLDRVREESPIQIALSKIRPGLTEVAELTAPQIGDQLDASIPGMPEPLPPEPPPWKPQRFPPKGIRESDTAKEDLEAYEAATTEVVTQETLDQFRDALENSPELMRGIQNSADPAATKALVYDLLMKAKPTEPSVLPQPASFNVKGLEPVEAITIAYQLGASEGSIDDLRTMLKDVGDIKGTTSSWAAAGGTAGFIPKDVQAQQMFSAYLKGIGQTRNLTDRELKLAMALNKQGLKFDKFALAQQREKRLDISAKHKRSLDWQKHDLNLDKLAMAKSKLKKKYKPKSGTTMDRKALEKWRTDLKSKERSDSRQYVIEKGRLSNKLNDLYKGLGSIITGSVAELKGKKPVDIAREYGTTSEFKRAVQNAVKADRKAQQNINAYEEAINRVNRSMNKLGTIQLETTKLWAEIAGTPWHQLATRSERYKKLVEVSDKLEKLQMQKLE